MNRFVIIRFSKQLWGVDVHYVAGVAKLSKEVTTTGTLPDYLYFQHRLISLIRPSAILGIFPSETTPTLKTRAVVINRGNVWLALAVDEFVSIEETEIKREVESNVATAVEFRRDLVQGAGTIPNGDSFLVIAPEGLISIWQEQAGEKAFPFPPNPRLGEKMLTDHSQSKHFYTGAERRSHLRLERTERVLIQKSRQSGYPAYSTIISFRKDVEQDPIPLAKVVHLLQEFGIVMGEDAIYKPKILGKFGRHIGLVYITPHPLQTILNRLHEIQEIDHAELSSFL